MLQYSLLKLHDFACPVYHHKKSIFYIRQGGMEGIVLLVRSLKHYWYTVYLTGIMLGDIKNLRYGCQTSFL